MVGTGSRIAGRASIALVISALLVTWVSPAAAVGDPSAPRSLAPHRPARWTERFDGAADLNDVATSIVIGPRGHRVFVTGWRTTGPQDPEPYDTDYVTIAYSASTGNRLWRARYNGPAKSGDAAVAIQVAPDGSALYVIGTSDDAAGPFAAHEESIATVAYDASDGETLWTARYLGAAAEDEVATGLVVSRDGSAIYVGGNAESDSDADFLTVAYSTLDGTELWTARSFGGGSTDVAQGIDLAPDGSAVYVTGHLQTSTSFDYATVAYDATSGSELWRASFDGPAHGADGALAVAASPDGSLVFVTGESASASGLFDYATVAYDASTGTPSWSKRYRGPGGRDDIAWDVSTSPDGAHVYVTGESVGTSGTFDYETLSYDAGSGERVWGARYAGSAGGDDEACCVAISNNGATVYVVGTAVYGSRSSATLDYGTIAYAAGTGVRRWVARYDGPVAGHDHAHALAVAPDGSGVYVTGDSPGRRTGIGPLDYATVAY
jgi:hypothetical protein